MTKDIKRNRYKKKDRKRNSDILKRVSRLFCVVILIPVITVTMGSIFIFSYDLITQSDYFAIKEIQINGLETITETEILEKAGIEKGMNILSVNLGLIQKRLLTHPWIDSVDVERVIPCDIYIHISEHHALAIADIGDSFLINEKGKIFKKLTSSDPSDLPIIKGLELRDINDYHLEKESYFMAVMDILKLSKKEDGMIAYKHIHDIQVDRELGISLSLDNGIKTVKLGFYDYHKKFIRMRDILFCAQKVKQIDEIGVIDLNNLNRIVLTPTRT